MEHLHLQARGSDSTQRHTAVKIEKYEVMGRANDESLLLGDAQAFGAFYRRFEDPVLAYFLRRTGRKRSSS